MRALALLLTIASLIYGGAVVDGNPAEWAGDPVSFEMHRSGNPAAPLEALGYLRYDCAAETMFVYVDAIDGVPTVDEPWVKINGTKVADETTGQFAWVGTDGYEAGFSLAPGTYTMDVHVNVYDDGENQTAAAYDLDLTVECNPTAVDIYGLTLRGVTNGVRATWYTGQETDLVRMRVVEVYQGERVPVTDWIAAKNPGQLIGNTYYTSFSAMPWTTHCYQIEARDTINWPSYTAQECVYVPGKFIFIR